MNAFARYGLAALVCLAALTGSAAGQVPGPSLSEIPPSGTLAWLERQVAEGISEKALYRIYLDAVAAGRIDLLQALAGIGYDSGDGVCQALRAKNDAALAFYLGQGHDPSLCRYLREFGYFDAESALWQAIAFDFGVERLLAAGANPSLITRPRHPLQVAVTHQRPAELRRWLARGWDETLSEHIGYSPLADAFESGDPALYEPLAATLPAATRVDSLGRMQRYAAASGRLEALRWIWARLPDAGQPADLTRYEARTLLANAVQGARPELLDAVYARLAPQGSLALLGPLSELRDTLYYSLYVSRPLGPMIPGEPPAREERERISRELLPLLDWLEAKPGLEARGVSAHTREQLVGTMLYTGQPGILRALEARGLHFERKDFSNPQYDADGNPTERVDYDLASYFTTIETTKYLLQKGFSPAQADTSDGSTALDVALARPDWDWFIQLIRLGADPQRVSGGKRALQQAALSMPMPKLLPLLGQYEAALLHQTGDDAPALINTLLEREDLEAESFFAWLDRRDPPGWQAMRADVLSQRAEVRRRQAFVPPGERSPRLLARQQRVPELIQRLRALAPEARSEALNEVLSEWLSWPLLQPIRRLAEAGLLDAQTLQQRFEGWHGDGAELSLFEHGLRGGDLALASRLYDDAGRRNISLPGKAGWLAHAAYSGNRDLVAWLLEREPGLAAGDSEAQALRLAVEAGSPKLVDLLLKHGASPDPAGTPGEGRDTSPLMHAITIGHYDLIDLLLAHGASRTRLDINDQPPLHQLLQTRDLAPTLRFLLSRGFDINQADRQGKTLLHWFAGGAEPAYKPYSATSLQADVLDLLLRLGADPSLKDKSGHTALDAARKRRDQAAIAVLSKPPH